MFIAANSADTFGIVGSLGHNILVAPTIVSTQGAIDGLASYRHELAEAGHDESERSVFVTVHVNVSNSEAEARKGFETTINNYIGTLRDMGSSARAASRASSRAESLDYETVLDEFAAVGTPEQVTDKLLRFQEMYNPQGIICWFNTGGLLTHAQVESSMRLFAAEVMPHLG